MERLTKRSELHPNEIGTTDMVGALAKLADYEDAEEYGLLFKVPCHCKDCVHVNYEGCAGTTCYCIKKGCFMQNDDFCVYAEKRMKAREK